MDRIDGSSIGMVFAAGAANTKAVDYTGLGINGDDTMTGLDNFGTAPSEGDPVPEPGALLLFAAGPSGVGLIRNRRIAQK